MSLSLSTASDQQTRALGRKLGSALRPGDCLALSGEMGAGKTVLAQGLVAGAGGGDDVRSPTFLLHAVHRGRIEVHHLDLFRMPAGTNLRTLGIDEALISGAAIVEWGERTDPGWFTGSVLIKISGEDERSLELRLPSHLAERVTNG